MVRWWVCRLHVSLTDRQVLRALQEATSDRVRTETPRELRRRMYQDALDQHHANQRQCDDVCAGRVWPCESS